MIKPALRRVVLADLYQRSASGVFIHCVGLSVVPLLSTKIGYTDPFYVSLMSVALAVMLARLVEMRRVLVHARTQGREKLFEERVDVLPHILLHLLGPLSWNVGVLSLSFALREPILLLYFAVSTAAIASFGTQNFSPHMLLSGLMAAALMPAALVPLTLFPSGDRIAAGAMGTFIFSIIVVLGVRRSRDYAQMLRQELTIRLQRAKYARLSGRDPLTGLMNRRQFEKLGTFGIATAARTRSWVMAAILDIDHFKRINDTHGHPAGDQCIKAVAGLLREHVKRRSDLVARIGGEEFAVLLILGQEQPTFAILDLFRARLENEMVDHGASTISVTVSVGAVACRPGATTELLPLFRAADGLLYEAKRSGRNRVVSQVGDDCGHERANAANS